MRVILTKAQASSAILLSFLHIKITKILSTTEIINYLLTQFFLLFFRKRKMASRNLFVTTVDQEELREQKQELENQGITKLLSFTDVLVIGVIEKPSYKQTAIQEGDISLNFLKKNKINFEFTESIFKNRERRDRSVFSLRSRMC